MGQWLVYSIIRWLDSIQERVKTIVRTIGRECDEYTGKYGGEGLKLEDWSWRVVLIVAAIGFLYTPFL